MITTYYDLMLAASLVLMLVYVFVWHKHFDIHIALVFVLVPINNLAYSQLCRVQTLEEALLAIKMTYIAGSYLFPIMTLSVFSLCHIRLSAWLRADLLTLRSLI